MRFAFAAADSTATSASVAASQSCAKIREQLTGPPDVVFLFVSSHHAQNACPIASSICDALECRTLVGCTGESIVAGSREFEWQPALSIWAACLPGVTAIPFHLDFERTPDGGSMIGWPDPLMDQWPAESSLVVLGDPFSFPADFLLERINDEHAGVPVIGGMASGGGSPGANCLLLGREVFSQGATALLLHGPLRLKTIVSQGCRPVGQPFVITKAERNVIFELGGHPALEQLKELFASLPNREQAAAQHGLHLGRVVSEYHDQLEQGDFLVRNVMGVVPDDNAVVITDYVRVGQTVQFHIRDEGTADAEMAQLLRSANADSRGGARGALLFTCNGRGTRLFSQPHHDAGLIQTILGATPLAGFFAQGEIGPVGGKNFLHGFTASIALFEEKPF